MSTASKMTRLTDGPDCRRRGHQHFELKPFATLTPGKAWGSSPFGGGLAHYDSRLLELCRSSDIHGTLDATKPGTHPRLLRGFLNRAPLIRLDRCATSQPVGCRCPRFSTCPA